MFAGDRALASTIPSCVAVGLFVQDLPLKCHVPKPGAAPGPPNTQTLLGLNAVTPVSSPKPVNRFDAADQLVPLKCRMYPPWSLTAQTSLADGALAALIVSVSPPGSVLAFQLLPCQCSAAGEPPRSRQCRREPRRCGRWWP
jgi:hypothetical protein